MKRTPIQRGLQVAAEVLALRALLVQIMEHPQTPDWWKPDIRAVLHRPQAEQGVQG